MEKARGVMGWLIPVSTPPPFTGGGWGVGEGVICRASATFPPTLTLPRKGGGDSDQSPLRTTLGIVLLAMLGMFLAACQPQTTAPQAKPPRLVKHFGNGPLTLTLSLDRERLTMAEELHVELRAETDESQAVKMTTDLNGLPDLQVVEESESEPELLTGDRVAVTLRYTLEPLAPGEVHLPTLTVEAWESVHSPLVSDGGKREQEAAITTVRTEPVTIRVDSLLGEGDAGETITDIAPPVAQPVSPWLWAGAGAALLLILALIGYLWQKQRARAAIPPPPLPPHLLAYQALDRLLATDLLAQGEMQPFYATLSDILRCYLEQGFGLRAPERTTEEFLMELRMVASGPIADPGHKRLLRDFLNRCDLVKFARESPNRLEAEAAVELCRFFVRETEPKLSSSQPGGTT